jgi:hypothetical protein
MLGSNQRKSQMFLNVPQPGPYIALEGRKNGNAETGLCKASWVRKSLGVLFKMYDKVKSLRRDYVG